VAASLPVSAAALAARARLERAGYWQLVWWRFRRHRLALLGLAILAVVLALSLGAEFVAPYGPQERSRAYTQGPPMGIHLIDHEGGFHLRPFVHARTSARDPVTLRQLSVADPTERWPIEFLVRGQPYVFWGLFTSDLHLFGTPDGFVHLFGTDQLGRDVFSRVLYATRVSLSVGAVGVLLAFVLGIVLGGIAGYRGGLVDEAIMRLIEFIRSTPTLPLWLTLAAALPRDWT
jgi:peptide/nickel transport system permease protein